MSTRIYDSTHQQTDQVRGVLTHMPELLADWPAVQAQWLWGLVAGLHAAFTSLASRLHHPGENLDYGQGVSAAMSDLNDKWDALPQGYRIAVFAATRGLQPIVRFADAGYVGNLRARLDLLDAAAKATDRVVTRLPADGEGAVYDFLDATNKFLRNVGSSAVNVAKSIASAPGDILGGLLGSIPWGKLALTAAGLYVGSRVIGASRKARK